MDELQSEASNMSHGVADISLPAVVAGLEMLTVNTNAQPSEKRRVLRKRIPRNYATENLNRRCTLKPRKRTSSEMENDSSSTNEEDEVGIKNYYLNRKLKSKLNNLETIYEERDINECSSYMSVKRYKRMIQFEQKPSDSKLKKRRAKIKKVFGSKISFKKRYTSMQLLLDKLSGIRTDSPIKADGEVK